MSSAIRDVTESRKAEEKFRGLLESAPDAMVIVNQQPIVGFDHVAHRQQAVEDAAGTRGAAAIERLEPADEGVPVLSRKIGIAGSQHDEYALDFGACGEPLQRVIEQRPVEQRQILLGLVRAHARAAAGRRH